MGGECLSLPQVPGERREHVQELTDQLQGKVLHGYLGAPCDLVSITQVGLPQCLQQGDDTGQQRGLQEPGNISGMAAPNQELCLPCQVR